MTVRRYIELNPLRAGIATHATEYPLVELSIELITPHNLYLRLAKTAITRQKRY